MPICFSVPYFSNQCFARSLLSQNDPVFIAHAYIQTRRRCRWWSFGSFSILTRFSVALRSVCCCCCFRFIYCLRSALSKVSIYSSSSSERNRLKVTNLMAHCRCCHNKVNSRIVIVNSHEFILPLLLLIICANRE